LTFFFYIEIPRNGLPHPASFSRIIEDLFQNESFRTSHDIQYKQTFSRVYLTPDQKEKLVYPPGFTPINFYLIYQTDKFDKGALISYEIELVSFVKKNDGYTYGYYFDVFAQQRFDTHELKTSRKPVSLSSVARFVISQYLEIYNDVNGTTIILSLSTLNPADPWASLQYSHKCKYFYQSIYFDGIRNHNVPETKLLGLSVNLEQS